MRWCAIFELIFITLWCVRKNPCIASFPLVDAYDLNEAIIISVIMKFQTLIGWLKLEYISLAVCISFARNGGFTWLKEVYLNHYRSTACRPNNCAIWIEQYRSSCASELSSKVSLANTVCASPSNPKSMKEQEIDLKLATVLIC